MVHRVLSRFSIPGGTDNVSIPARLLWRWEDYAFSIRYSLSVVVRQQDDYLGACG